MEIQYSTTAGQATPEYVLAVLRDNHRQLCQFDPAADPDATLTFDTTVADWRLACDLLSWRELGKAQNQIWNIHCSHAEWKSVLEPARQRRLIEVCELIASQANRPLIRSFHIFGRCCRPAGTFLTIRSMLNDAGANAEEISPSTLLAPYARRHPDLFLDAISRLAPGALPSVRIKKPKYDSAVSCSTALLTCFAVGLIFDVPWLAIACGLAFVGSYFEVWQTARQLPESVEFGDVQTFRDLATVLTEHAEFEPDSNSESSRP